MKIAIIVLLFVLTASLACIAAEDAKVSLEAEDMPIDAVMADLAKQAGVQILCDPSLTTAITGSFASIELERLLDSITKSNELTWQKLYLTVSADEKPTLEQVRARAKAVAAVSTGTMAVYDPATGKQRVFVEQDSASPSVDPVKLGLTPVYLVDKPEAETPKTAEESSEAATKFAALQTQRLELLANMTPEQRVGVMQAEMIQMLNMDEHTRQQYMLDQMRARNEMDPRSREMLRDAMHQTFRNLRDQGLMPDWRRDNDGDRRERGDDGDRRRGD